MNLPALSIRRHVLAFMLNALLVLFGIIAFNRIGVDRYPLIDFPVVSVATSLPGANPDVVDASITNLIESAVNSIPGVDFIASTSGAGLSYVNVQFQLSKDIDVAFNEVQAKVNQVLRNLPEDADPPVVGKVEVGAQAVLWLSLQGNRTIQQLNQYARNVIQKRLETIDGVGEIQLGGRRERTIRIEVDLELAAAFGVTARDISNALRNEHLQLPGGFLVSDQAENLIKLDLEFHSPRDLEQLIVRFSDGAPVRLVDIATVVDGIQDHRQIARYKGTPTIGLGVVKVSTSNTVAVVEAVIDRLNSEIIPQLPAGMSLHYSTNDARVIREQIDALNEHLIAGVILASLVVWFFLRSFGSTLIIATAIPVSLMGAIALMYFLGYTFNNMTMLALLLLIGVVVDDAIVVLENIYRHQENIEPDPVKAAERGSAQVVFAVVASSLTLISIFGSVLFLGGIIGRFFESFAAVVTVGVAASLLVSLTLTPMLCSRYLRVKRSHGRTYQLLQGWFDGLENGYRRALSAALNHRWAVITVALGIVLSSGYFFSALGQEFMPQEDEGQFMINFRTPLGTSIDANDRYMRQIEEVLAAQQDVDTYFSVIGVDASGQINRGMTWITMPGRDRRSLSQERVISELRQSLGQLPGVQAFITPASPIAGRRGEELQFGLTGPGLIDVARYAEQMSQILNNDPRISFVDMELDLNLPQIRLSVDRTRASDLGLSAGDVAFAVNMLAGGMDVAKYNDDPGDGERYDVRVKAREDQLKSPADLSLIVLRTADGELVRLDTVATVEEITGAAVIDRMNLRYAANFYGVPNVPLGEALDLINETAADILPPGFEIAPRGRVREFARTSGYVRLSFSLAVILVFMVLASQFNSLIQPLIVMIAQPLAVVGGLAGLWITGHTLNIYSMIGMTLLMGLVAKNSILLVDLTNQTREQGRSVDEALREACPIRLRPVLITSLTVILALLPAALGFGVGAATNGPLAVAVIGGMASSTLLTLIVVPVAYSLIEGRREPKQIPPVTQPSPQTS